MPAPNSALTQQHILRELRQLAPNQQLEVLDFVRFLGQKRRTRPSFAQTNTPTKKAALVEFVGVLKTSPNFNGDPLTVQQELRSEWPYQP
ncbi:MAG: DUF2281 domain-containing protein [Thiolinea sp.]